jgi:hypothetical protein
MFKDRLILYLIVSLHFCQAGMGQIESAESLEQELGRFIKLTAQNNPMQKSQPKPGVRWRSLFGCV